TIVPSLSYGFQEQMVCRSLGAVQRGMQELVEGDFAREGRDTNAAPGSVPRRAAVLVCGTSARIADRATDVPGVGSRDRSRLRRLQNNGLDLTLRRLNMAITVYFLQMFAHPHQIVPPPREDLTIVH